MVKKTSAKRYMKQVIAITEKNIFIELRNKPNLFLRFFNPIIQMIMLMFIFGILFQIKEGYRIGYWDAENFILFLLIAFAIQFPRAIISRFNDILVTEKYWKTLSAIIVAPVHRFTLLVGIICSELAIVSVFKQVY